MLAEPPEQVHDHRPGLYLPSRVHCRRWRTTIIFCLLSISRWRATASVRTHWQSWCCFCAAALTSGADQRLDRAVCASVENVADLESTGVVENR